MTPPGTGGVGVLTSGQLAYLKRVDRHFRDNYWERLRGRWPESRHCNGLIRDGYLIFWLQAGPALTSKGHDALHATRTTPPTDGNCPEQP